MYIRLALAILAFCVGLLQAQITDSLTTKDSLYSKVDTVYIQQPPLIIKKQVVVHDTVAEVSNPNLKIQRFKEGLSSNWYIDATVGLDHWLGKDEVIDTIHFNKKAGYSAAISIGKEIGSFHASVGVGMQEMILHEQLEKVLIRYDSIKHKFIAKDPQGNDDCFYVGSKPVCVIDSTYIKDTIVSKSIIVNKHNIEYITLPIKIGKRFEFDNWYFSPEVWIIPMLTLESSSFMESSKLKFNHKQTAYRIMLNAGIPISKKLNIELGAGYQSSLGRSSLDMQFVNLHFGLKYYISKGTQ